MGKLGTKIAMKQNVLPTKDVPFYLDIVNGGVKITKKVVIKLFHNSEDVSPKQSETSPKNVHILTEDRGRMNRNYQI